MRSRPEDRPNIFPVCLIPIRLPTYFSSADCYIQLLSHRDRVLLLTHWAPKYMLHSNRLFAVYTIGDTAGDAGPSICVVSVSDSNRFRFNRGKSHDSIPGLLVSAWIVFSSATALEWLLFWRKRLYRRRRKEVPINNQQKRYDIYYYESDTIYEADMVRNYTRVLFTRLVRSFLDFYGCITFVSVGIV